MTETNAERSLGSADGTVHLSEVTAPGQEVGRAANEATLTAWVPVSKHASG